MNVWIRNDGELADIDGKSQHKSQLKIAHSCDV
jgi:hypothetical protein